MLRQLAGNFLALHLLLIVILGLVLGILGTCLISFIIALNHIISAMFDTLGGGIGG